MEIVPPRPDATEGKERIKLRILVAEDDPSLQMMYRLVLKAKGYEVEIVDNGKLLIEKLLEEGKHYDIIITDYEMPVQNGIDALKKIRSINKFRKFPVIVLTGLGDNPEIEGIINDLDATCMSKPFILKELSAKIEELTKKSSTTEGEK